MPRDARRLILTLAKSVDQTGVEGAAVLVQLQKREDGHTQLGAEGKVGVYQKGKIRERASSAEGPASVARLLPL